MKKRNPKTNSHLSPIHRPTGTAALFIASKYEEIYPPELKDFIFVTDDAYTKLQMLSMEKVILKSLSFNISPPTIFYFLKYFLTKLSLPVYVQHFAEVGLDLFGRSARTDWPRLMPFLLPRSAVPVLPLITPHRSIPIILT